MRYIANECAIVTEELGDLCGLRFHNAYEFFRSSIMRFVELIYIERMKIRKSHIGIKCDCLWEDRFDFLCDKSKTMIVLYSGQLRNRRVPLKIF